jgi:signal transduction histidine kinase
MDYRSASDALRASVGVTGWIFDAAMTSSDIATIVHATGFITGIALYAMLAVMTLRARTVSIAARSDGSRVALSSLGDRIPLVTALLGIIWNAGGLVIYGGRDIGAAPPSPYLVAVAFAALGFLPAVVVHAAAGHASRRARWLTTAAYALSFTGAAMQVGTAISSGIAPYRPALVLLTVGYGVVVGVLAVAMRGQSGGRGPLAVAALAAFAVMALHLSHHVEGRQSLAIELVGHHASLPLVLVILYQDYRFAFADLFLKRALALVVLVSLALAAYLLVAVPLVLPRLAADPTDPRGTAALVALWVAVALAYPVIRAAQSRFVDRVVLRRVDAARLRGDATHRLGTLDSTERVLDAACAMLAPALSARTVRWSVAETYDDVAQSERDDSRIHTRIVVPTSESPRFWIEVGVLAGGRRMLSDDMALADAVADASARRIDVLRVAQERHERSLRERDLERLTTESEFRTLQAQLNPHFLFNALTTIGFLLHESPERALDTLLKLTGLLRAVLRRSSGEFVTLGEEMEIVESYLAIERARFEDRLNVCIDVDAALRGFRVPPLLLQPLVENAVKHGIAHSRQGGTITVTGTLDRETDVGAHTLRFAVIDTGAGTSPESMARRRAIGTGLKNLEARLRHYYGAAGSISVRSSAGHGTRVELVVPVAVTTLESRALFETRRSASEAHK